MKRMLYKVYIRRILVDQKTGSISAEVSFTRHGRIIGKVPIPNTEEFQFLAKQFPRILAGTFVIVQAKLNDRGKLINPKLIGLGRSMRALEKLASASTASFDAAVLEWYRGGKKKKDLQSVIKELRTLVGSRASDYAKGTSTEISRAEYMKAGLKAVKKYDPRKGAKPSTYVISSLREAHRPLLRGATVVRVPEERLQKVGKVTRAIRELEDELGRPPTTAEIAKRSGVNKSSVELLRKEVLPIHLHSKEAIPIGEYRRNLSETWALLRPELKGNELKVYTALSKNPKLSNTALAKRLRISPSQVSRYRQRLRKRVLNAYNR